MADHTSILYNEQRLRDWCVKNNHEGIYDPSGDMLDTLHAFADMDGAIHLGYDMDDDIQPAMEWAAEQHAKRILASPVGKAFR